MSDNHFFILASNGSCLHHHQREQNIGFNVFLGEEDARFIKIFPSSSPPLNPSEVPLWLFSLLPVDSFLSSPSAL